MTEAQKKNAKKLVCNVYQELIRTERMHRAIVSKRLADIGLRPAQFSILREVEYADSKEGGHAISQKDIAERFSVSPAAVAMALKKMEAEKLVSRKISTADNRFNEVHLAQNGKKLLEKSGTIFDKINEETYSGISDEELEITVRCLRKMQENLSGMPEYDGKTEPAPELGHSK